MSLLRNARVVATVLAIVVLGACGSETGSGAQNSSSTSHIASASGSPTPKGPATAEFTFTGDPALAAPLTNVKIECLAPSFDGPGISLSGTPQGQPPGGLSVSLQIHEGSVAVTIFAGSGASSTERDFTGAGTSAFDAAAGVHLSGGLTENTPATAKKGTIGTVTSVSGSVSCGDQTMGTSTIRVTGTTPEGAMDIVLSPARVVCRNGASGYFIGVNGIVTVLGTQALVFVTLGQTSLQVAVDRRNGGPSHFYVSQGQVGTSVSSSGGQVDGNATEQAGTGAPGTVHVTGAATCGSSTTY